MGDSARRQYHKHDKAMRVLTSRRYHGEDESSGPNARSHWSRIVEVEASDVAAV